jgi:uncharacterized membrane-anchored protein YjiN (DUF445 family)
MFVKEIRLAIDEKTLGEMLEEIYKDVIPDNILDEIALDINHSAISPQQLRIYLDDVVSRLLQELEIEVCNI